MLKHCFCLNLELFFFFQGVSIFTSVSYVGLLYCYSICENLDAAFGTLDILKVSWTGLNSQLK